MFASSNHAVGFYPRDQKIGVDVTVRPDSRYGVSKAFGEALGALYADKHGLRVTCMRIGNFDDAPVDKRRLSIWIKPDDLVQLIRIGLEHPDIRFEIFYGASDNAASLVGQQQCPPLRLQAARQGGRFPRPGDGGAEEACARPYRRALPGRALIAAMSMTRERRGLAHLVGGEEHAHRHADHVRDALGRRRQTKAAPSPAPPNVKA